MNQDEFSSFLESERPRIVRLCARIARNRHAAEDLTQETIVEAWRSAGRLRDPAAARAWLNGIARNVCRRWTRRRGRESSRLLDAGPRIEDVILDQRLSPEDRFDLEAHLERSDLVDLLDKALNLLPPVTREALIHQFVDELPQQEIAQRLGMSRGAVAMRIQRGKLLLRRVLVDRFPADAESFGLLRNVSGWVETRIWCPLCGQQRFHVLINKDEGEFFLKCSGCYATSGIMWCEVPRRVNGLLCIGDEYRATYHKLMGFMREYLLHALTNSLTECLNCGSKAILIRSIPDIPVWTRESYGVHVRCPNCKAIQTTDLRGMLLCHPEGDRFWRDHKRIHALPEKQVEFDGRPAIVSTFESVASADALVAVTDATTLNVLKFKRTSR